VFVRRRGRHETGEREIAELAALADRSLPPDRVAELEARVAASPELADRLAEQRHAVALAESAAAEAAAPGRLRARIDAQRQGRRSRPQRRAALAVAVTAAVAAAIVVAVVALGSSSGTQRFRAALGPTPLAPAATGEANLAKTSAGWRIELDAKGLPRLDGGRFYEAWLRSPAGELVPVGTFNESTKVTLWAGVPPSAYPTLTVTRERADGDQASSGERVLVGKITGRS
jgi:hypothetical protein